MIATPLELSGPPRRQADADMRDRSQSVAFTLAGAEVYGFSGSVSQVEAVKDRGLALRDRIHLQTGAMNQLAYPDRFFDLAFGKTVPENADLESGVRELGRVLKPGRAGSVRAPDRGAAAGNGTPGLRFRGDPGRVLDWSGEELGRTERATEPQ